MWKDNESSIDYIDFEYIADLVNKIVLSDDLLPASIGVYGDWGSGKSSIMSMSQKAIIKKDNKALTINFNAWLFEGYGDTKNTVINCILDSIEERVKEKDTLIDNLKRLRKSISGFDLMKTLVKNSSYIISSIINPANLVNVVPEASADILNCIEGIKEKYEALTSHQSLRNDISNFRREFGSLIEESGISRVVVYVDEMDRCLPDTVLEIFEAMRLFLFNGKVAFVFGADERQISYAIRQKYTDSMFESEYKINIGQEYLEKIIQYPIRIPTMTIPETEIYLTLLKCSKTLDEERLNILKEKCIEQLRKNSSDWLLPETESIVGSENKEFVLSCYQVAKKISRLLNSGLNGNPRQFKRFLNEFEMRKSVAQIKKITIDDKILVKMMILQYVKPNIFADFIDLYGQRTLNAHLKDCLEDNNGGKDKSIKVQTNSIKTELKKKKWQDDEWFKKWMDCEPDISEAELEPYFYLSRNSNKVFNYNSHIKLSEAVREILNAYLGENDIMINQAQGKIEELSESECNSIVEELYSAIIKGTAKKNINAVRGIVGIVQNKPECLECALKYLRMIPAKIISQPMIVHVGALKKINGDEINNLISEWKSEIKNRK